MNQLSAYLPTVIRNLPSGGGVQTLNRDTGFGPLEQLGELPTVGTFSGGAARPQGPAITGPQLDMRRMRSGAGTRVDRGNLMKSPVEPPLQETEAISAQD